MTKQNDQNNDEDWLKYKKNTKATLNKEIAQSKKIYIANKLNHTKDK